jgi:hypothetical protein
MLDLYEQQVAETRRMNATLNGSPRSWTSGHKAKD